MKVGYTVWTWMKDQFGRDVPTDDAAEQFEQALKEISYLGYETVENFNFLVPIYEDKPEELDALLKKYKVELVNVYHFLSGEYDKDIAFAERICKFLKAHNAKLMNLECPHPATREDIPTEAQMQELCEVLNKIGKLCQSYGVTLCVHPHYGTYCETQPQLEYVDAHTDPELVKYCLDTAHLIFGGMDAVEMFNQYGGRAAYVHLKDTLADRTPPVDFPTRFARPLGEGIVDFPGVMKALEKHHYDGIICVELDYQPICNFDSAQKSRAYIHSVLGL